MDGSSVLTLVLSGNFEDKWAKECKSGGGVTYRILTSRRGRDVADTDSQRQDQANQDSRKDEGGPQETIPV